MEIKSFLNSFYVENPVEKVENYALIQDLFFIIVKNLFRFKTFCNFSWLIKIKKFLSKFVSFYENMFYTEIEIQLKEFFT